MIRFLAQRLVASLLILFLVLTLTFLLLQLVPGDVIESVVRDPRIPEAQKERLRTIYGLDAPPLEQYVEWLQGVVLELDLGYSLPHARPVIEVLGQYLPPTHALTGAALLVQYLVGFVLGVLACRYRGGIVDHAIRAGSLTLYSLPVFWLGLMAILLFSNTWELFPPSHLESVSASRLAPLPRMLDRLHHLILPAVVLGAPLAGGVARFLRNSLLEVIDQDYIRAARARGLSEGRVIWRHAARNAVVPLVQVLGISVPLLLSGSFALEFVFSWPGLGLMTWNAVVRQDYPLILATTVLSGTLVAAGNLLADVLHAVVDPRIHRA